MGAIVYEIRQALTYLQQRPDVDPQRIGVTGLSFGGITSFYTWLTDDRIAAAASICGGVGSVETLLQIGHPSYHGYYWWIPGMLEHGDQGEFAAAMAPRPLMLWAPLQDIGMPKEGVDRFLECVIPAYQRAGATRSLIVHQPPGEHEFTLEAFKAMTQFFDSQFKPSSGAGNEIIPLRFFYRFWYLYAHPLLAGPSPTELYLRGYSLIPAPQRVQLRPQEVLFDATWACEVRQVSANHVAVRTL